MAPDRSWRARLRTTVLEASTPSGRAYNVVVFGAILVSVLALMLEPDPFGNSALRQTDVVWIDLVQNICLGIFAADFVLHLFVSERPLKYLFSFYGLIDFTAVLFFFIPQVRSEILLWVFKFGRILRVFKLLRFIDEARMLGRALRGSARTICVYLFFVFMLQVVLGYCIFVIESASPDSQFKTISNGVYWAIVTMTTVGYGDVVPQTALQEWSQGQGLGLPSYSTEERNRRHGDPRRFQSLLTVGDHLSAEGWGPSRKEAEQAAARAALDQLEPDG